MSQDNLYKVMVARIYSRLQAMDHASQRIRHDLDELKDAEQMPRDELIRRAGLLRGHMAVLEQCLREVADCFDLFPERSAGVERLMRLVQAVEMRAQHNQRRMRRFDPYPDAAEDGL